MAYDSEFIKQSWFNGLSGWSGSNTFRSAAGTGPTGSETMAVGVALRVDAVPSGVQFIFAHNQTVAGGFYIFSSGANVHFVVFNGAGSDIASSAYTIVAGDVGDMHTFLGTYSGGKVRLFHNGVQAGTDVTTTGYTAPTGAMQTAIGTRGDASGPATDYTILGALASDESAPTIAQAQHWHDTVRGRQRIVSFPQAGTTFMWARNPGAFSPWECEISGLGLTKAGSLVSEIDGWVFG